MIGVVARGGRAGEVVRFFPNSGKGVVVLFRKIEIDYFLRK